QRHPCVGPLAHSVISRLLVSRAGLPITTLQGLTSFIATALAPTIAPSPIVTPGPTNASAQIHASGPIVIGGRSNGKSDFVWSCVPAQTCARWEIVTRAPSV